VRVEVERARIDVGEHGSRALVDEAVRARLERVRARDHLVARTERSSVAQQVESGGPTRDGDGVRGTDALGEGLLETRNERPQRQPTRTEHVEHELLLALVEVRRRERDRALLELHARSGAGAYSSHCAQRSDRPRTVSRYASWISTVTGPGGPTTWSSTSRIGVTSAAVPTMNTSSAR